jgi:hypothetical protein
MRKINGMPSTSRTVTEWTGMEQMKAMYWSESVVEASLIGPAGDAK